MKKKIVYISELGREYSTAVEAIKDDAQILKIIETLKGYLRNMRETGKLGVCAATPENIERWEAAIINCEALWEEAKRTRDLWIATNRVESVALN